ncbi:hypothetical protein N0V82_002092 [Gnomoniopsis sp. IMI 355080]|nr:hypothetical protein N0V82_002092 [Gnomoniopsis sp. IMI 355080]
MSGKEVVHRVAGLPVGASQAAAKSILEDIFGPDTIITVRSVGVHPQAASALVATVIFSPVPSQLRNSKYKISEVVRFEGQHVQLNLEIDTSFIGFTPLNTVNDSQDGQIDCILVSGLGSHAFGSWKERGGQYMWPIDSDDARPPNVRLFLWGYDSSLTNSESFQDIEDIGQSLATALKGIHPSFARSKNGEEQKEFDARPVVFIAHSLGGLVVKEALCHMVQDDPAYVRCVYGLVFFGVPHHGLHVEPWLRIIGEQANASLIRSLEPNSRNLQRLDKAFRKTFQHSGSKVISIYETVRSSTAKQDRSGNLSRSGESQILVNRISACGTWPECLIHKELPMNRTHEDLPKFKGRFDDSFLILRPMLDDIWATAFAVVQGRFNTNERGRLMGRAEIARSVDSQRAYGLFQVWPIPGSEDTDQLGTDVDLIAIHGLGGHPSDTWTCGRKNWLCDFLPSEISALRVLTFGYNSTTAFNGSSPGSGITEVAQNLLDAIIRLRQSHNEPSNRKIVFVCHSLGGMILKKAVLLSDAQGQKPTFADNITGVVFLSAPNKSNRVGYWTLGSPLYGLLYRLGTVDEAVKSGGVEPALRKSTNWLIGHPNFVSWIQGSRSHRVVWIYGPPGSGKTVLMKTVVAHMDEKPMVADKNLIYKPIHFFFNFVEPSQNSTMAFVKSVLTQIITDKTTRFVFKYVDLPDYVVSNVETETETEDELWAYLLVIVQRSRGIILQITIDALDEALRAASLGSNSIIDRLQELLAADLHGRVRLLVSHRQKKVPGISIEEDIPKIDVHNDFTHSNVYAFIHKTVCRSLDHLSFPEQTKVTIEEKIMDVSQGNYLHATLAWQHFAQGVQTWNRSAISSGLRRLDGLSLDLISFYCRLLSGIDSSYRARARTAFAILRVCREKLRMRQLAFLATLYEMHGMKRSQELPLDTVSSIEPRCLDFENFMSESCAYLIKKAEDGTVDYAHTSAKDLFTKSHDNLSLEYSKTLSEYSMSSQDAHGIMDWLCTSILELEIRGQEGWVKLVEASYSILQPVNNKCDLLESQHRTIGREKHDVKLGEETYIEMLRQKEERKQESDSGRERVREPGEKTIKTSTYRTFLLETRSVDHAFTQIWKAWIDETSSTPCFFYSILHWVDHYEAAAPSLAFDQQHIAMMTSQVGHISHMLWVFLKKATVPHYELNQAATLKSIQESSLLRIIARGDYPSLIRTLINEGADPNHVTHVTSLCQKDAHLQKEEHGITPLSWAIVCQREKTFELLMRNDRIQVNHGARDSPKPLHFATCKCPGGTRYIERLVQHPDCNVNIRDHKGTPLHLALHEKNYAAVVIILNQENVDIWATDDSDHSAYSRALKRGVWGSIFERMLQASKKTTRETLSEMVEGTSQLALAGTHGWTNVEEVILREDLPQLFLVNPTTRMSPLLSTAYFGRKEKLLWMLDRVPPTGFPIRRKNDSFDLLHLCADHGWEHVVQLLQRKYGLKSLRSDHKGRTLLHWAIEYGWDMDQFKMSESRDIIDLPDRDGWTAMHLAVMARNLDAIKALTDASANCFIKDNNGMTPAHVAAEVGFREALEFFIAMPRREFGRTQTGASLLHLLALWFDGYIIHQFVLRKRALVDVVDKDRCTPLHYAAMVNNLSSIDALVGLGCSVNARNSSRRTPIHEAIRGGSVGAVLLLLKFGADYTAVDSFGQTCLLMSYRYNHDVLVSRFLKLGCGIHVEDMFGMTPLHRACANGNVPMILSLLRSGAKWRKRNRERRKPLELAVERRATSAVAAMVAWLWDTHRKSSSRKRLFDQALTLAIREKCGTSIESILESHKAYVDREAVREVRQIYRAGPTHEQGVLPLRRVDYT